MRAVLISLSRYLLPPLVAGLAACSATPPSAGESTAVQSDQAARQQLSKADSLVLTHGNEAAIVLYDQVIHYFDKTYADASVRVYSSRSLTETMAYALDAANHHLSSRIYAATWGQAYYGKGFALVELRRLSEAEAALDAAVGLAPQNSPFLSERAQIDALERHWPASLAGFEKALDATQLSPPQLQARERTRALRGMARADLEMNRLDEAESLHRRVLKIDPQDRAAQTELRLIARLRAARRVAPRAPATPMPAPPTLNRQAPAI